YRIAQSVLRDATRTLFWQIVGNSAAFASALLLAACVQFFGLNVSISVGAFACLLGFVVRAQFFGERGGRPAPAAGEPRDKASESDRFRSAFDFAAIGMALVSTEG